MNLKINKTHIILVLIFLLALILRITAASHVGIGPDEMVYSVLPLNIISAGQLSTVEQSPLYFYMTDVGYKLFGGVTPLSTRFPSIIFGSLSIFLIFLITNEIFKNKKASLFASLFFAVSGYTLTYNYEPDMMAYFFMGLSALFFLYAIQKKLNNLYLSSLFLAIAFLVKPTTILIAPTYIIVFAWWLYKKEPEERKSTLKKAIKISSISTAIFVITLMPIFVYNSLTYASKGITDYYFSNILGIGETVHGGLQAKSWSLPSLIKITWTKIIQLIKFDPIVFGAGIVGIITSFKKNKLGSSLFIISSLTLVLYLAGITGSNSHYIWLPFTLSIFAGMAASQLIGKLKSKINPKKAAIILTAIIIVISTILTSNIFTEKSSVLALREYTHENIPSNAVVILDPRVYNGIHAWTFNDKHYLQGSLFGQLREVLQQVESPPVTVPIYYIECGEKTTCLWSTEDYANVYNTSVALTEYFKANMQEVARIQGKTNEPGNRHEFIIHKGTINLPAEVYDIIDRTHQFWFYPVGWKYTDNLIDGYETSGLSKAWNGFGFLILYLNLLIALLAIPFIVYLTFKKEGGKTDEQ